MSFVAPWQLRTRFARQLSILYGDEVPAYNLLVDVCREINAELVKRAGAGAERLGSIGRVTAERHGAIRVGSVDELRQVSRIFGALAMRPTGFYDLRDAHPSPIPVVSTAFRPILQDKLARNPFRIFTSLLVIDDRRFFDASMQQRLTNFIAARELFAPELLTLADRATQDGGLVDGDADRFLELATGSFALSKEPVDRSWYAELSAVSAVAADIGGVARTHVNHLTPRVLDIDELYSRMRGQGVDMIDEIQGPPSWDGPDVLLRQTSFRALAERRLFRERDGSIVPGELRVRFGEVEARGIALTPTGRARYDALTDETDRLLADSEHTRQQIGAEVWARGFPSDEQSLVRQDLAFFTYGFVPDRRPDGTAPSTRLSELVDNGWLRADPIVYEDFLPRSAAGIFSSNLTGRGSVDTSEPSEERDATWLAEALELRIFVPEELYADERDRSLVTTASSLGLADEIS